MAGGAGFFILSQWSLRPDWKAPALRGNTQQIARQCARAVSPPHNTPLKGQKTASLLNQVLTLLKAKLAVENDPLAFVIQSSPLAQLMMGRGLVAPVVCAARLESPSATWEYATNRAPVPQGGASPASHRRRHQPSSMLISTSSVRDLVPRSITSFATHPTCSALLVHPDAVKDAELHALLHRYHAVLRDLHHAVETCRVWATKRITVRLIVMVQIVVHDEDHRGPDRQIAV